jgi:tetratricopeptide (TPR) repeat protein
MLRAVVVILALVGAADAALAASEKDRRDCATTPGPDVRIPACTSILEDAASTPPLRAMAYRNRAGSYVLQNLRDLAIADFDEALKLEPNDINALGGRGRAFLQSGQYDRAIADYTEVLRLRPGSDRAFNERGLAHLRKGSLEAALADFDAAVRTNPTSVVARNNRGFVFARDGKLDRAIEAYGDAIRTDPRYLLAYMNRGAAYEEKGALEQALADYKRVMAQRARPKVEDDQRARVGAKRRLARLTATIAEGRSSEARERRVALVIGNAAYAYSAPLRNPANDARALAAALRGLGFTEVRELYDARLADFTTALKEFGDLASGADWALIYFAGHGIEVGGVNYLIPVDARLENQLHVEDEALPLERLLGKVTGASKLQLVILDACRNNPFVPRMRTSGRVTRAIGRGLASMEPEGGVLVAYAARHGTTALDGESTNSPYAEALVKHVAEPGLEINLLFRKVRDEVFSKTGRQQEPYTYGSLPAQPFYFKR